jgi:hypothetical protein
MCNWSLNLRWRVVYFILNTNWLWRSLWNWYITNVRHIRDNTNIYAIDWCCRWCYLATDASGTCRACPTHVWTLAFDTFCRVDSTLGRTQHWGWILNNCDGLHCLFCWVLISCSFCLDWNGILQLLSLLGIVWGVIWILIN